MGSRADADGQLLESKCSEFARCECCTNHETFQQTFWLLCACFKFQLDREVLEQNWRMSQIPVSPLERNFSSSKSTIF